jgi:hypothetical protein
MYTIEFHKLDQTTTRAEIKSIKEGASLLKKELNSLKVELVNVKPEVQFLYGRGPTEQFMEDLQKFVAIYKGGL